jgi:aconitate hydratase
LSNFSVRAWRQPEPARPGNHRQHGPGIRRHHGLFPGGQRNPALPPGQRPAGTLVDLVERYCREQGFFFAPENPEPEYSVVYDILLDEVVPSLAGPKRPQDLLPLAEGARGFCQPICGQLASTLPPRVRQKAPSPATASFAPLTNGSVVIAAITSCTNTSNPDVMIGAGLLARKARQRGWSANPGSRPAWPPVPGSSPATWSRAASCPTLKPWGFHVVGYGCTTCIGNSGPLDESLSTAIKDNNLVVAAVLSGNRNFEARVHPQVRANYLASPPLVVAYALAGTVLIDLEKEPLGSMQQGMPVFLRDIWPSAEEIRAAVQQSLKPDLFTVSYSSVFAGDAQWQALSGGSGNLYQWDPGLLLYPRAALFSGSEPFAATDDRYRGRPYPRPVRRFDHHRPHQPGRFDRAPNPGRHLSPAIGHPARRFQQLRFPARQP